MATILLKKGPEFQALGSIKDVLQHVHRRGCEVLLSIQIHCTSMKCIPGFLCPPGLIYLTFGTWFCLYFHSGIWICPLELKFSFSTSFIGQGGVCLSCLASACDGVQFMSMNTYFLPKLLRLDSSALC